MIARIEDVARAAGVSTATVSRALRGLPNVSEPTRVRVAQVASDLGYVVSRTASTLASGRTLTVAVLSPFMERWFFSQLIAAVESALRTRGYDALLIGLAQPGSPGRDAFEPETLRGRADAVVVLTAPLTGGELDGVRRLAVPTVFIGASLGGAMSVRVDDVAIARTATEHLLQLGHERIAYVGGDPQEPINYTTPADRRAGWMATMRAAGLEPLAAYEEPGLFTPAGGREAGRRLLALPAPPTAVFAASDEMAYGVLAAARDAGVRVPEQLSVIGVDDHELSALVGLTTVAQPVARQGTLAAQLALDAIDGRSRAQEQVVVPVHLEIRGTTAPVPPSRP